MRLSRLAGLLQCYKLMHVCAFQLGANLLTLGWVSLCAPLCRVSSSHLLYRGAAACEESSRAELSYKADRGSSRASNLGAASALSN